MIYILIFNLALIALLLSLITYNKTDYKFFITFSIGLFIVQFISLTALSDIVTLSRLNLYKLSLISITFCSHALWCTFFKFETQENRKPPYIAHSLCLGAIVIIAIFIHNIPTSLFDILPVQSSLIPLMVLVFILYGTVSSLYASYRSYTLDEDNKFLFLSIFSVTISLITHIASYIYPGLSIYSILFMTASILIMFYAAIQYKLLDIKIDINLNVYFFSFFIFIIALCAFGISFLSHQYINYLSISSSYFPLFIDSIIWTSFIGMSYWIQKFLEQKTDTIFLMANYPHERLFDEISQKLNAITTMSALLSLLSNELYAAFKIDPESLWFGRPLEMEMTLPKYKGFFINTTCDLSSKRSEDLIFQMTPLISFIEGKKLHYVTYESLLLEQEQPVPSQLLKLMTATNTRVVIANMEESKCTGLIAIGKKRNGQPYNQKDIHLLTMIARQASLVTSKLIEIKEKAHLQANLEAKEAYHTELQEINVKLKQSIESLEKTQEQLVTSEKLAIVGRISGGVAHDMRHPLSEINEFTEVIDRNKLFSQNETIIDYLDLMIKNNTCHMEEFLSSLNILKKNNTDIHTSFNKVQEARLRLNRFTDDFLSYAKASQLVPSKKIRIDPLIKTIANHYKTLCKRKGIHFTLSLKSKKWVKIYDHQIERICHNILSNAMEAIEENNTEKKTISLDVYNQKKDQKQEVIVKIKDTGIGIPEAILPKIFEPFYSHKISKKGTGLGLNIISNMVESLNGHISVDSTPDFGTTFCVNLPCFDSA